MRNTLIIASVIAVLVITATLFAAQAPKVCPPKGAGPGMQCDWTRGKIARELNLSKDQMDKLKEIHTEFFNATKDTREQLKAKRQQMIALWSVDQPDAAAIKSLFTEMDPLKVQLREAAVDHAVQAYDILTPAQKVKVRQMIKAHVNRMGAGCGMMGGDMEGGAGGTQ